MAVRDRHHNYQLPSPSGKQQQLWSQLLGATTHSVITVKGVGIVNTVMFSGRPPAGFIVNINIIIISNITHILICGTVYDNVFDYISVSSLMLIMHRLTPISYTLYFRLYQYFVLPIKCLEISTARMLHGVRISPQETKNL